MRKRLLIAGVVTMLMSSTAMANDFKLTVDNQSKASGLQLFSSTDSKNTKNLKKGKNDFKLSTRNQYQIRIPNKQIMASIKQDSSSFVVQETPATATSGLQKIKVNISTSNGSSGSYSAIIPADPKGVCSNDMGGIVCRLGESVPSSISIKLTGGEAPKPVAEYIYDAGKWDGSKIYQVRYSPTLYPKVTYAKDKKEYVGCWYATGQNIPGKGDPWRLYNKMKNVCSQ